MTKQAKSGQNALMSDLQTVLADTETMLKEVANEGGEMAHAVRERIAANLKTVRAKLLETEELVTEKAKLAAKVTDDYVRENPWQSIGVAAGVAFLLGLLVSRR